MAREWSRRLVGGVEHHAVKSRLRATLGYAPDVRRAIRKHHGHEPEPATRQFAKRRPGRGKITREDTDLHDVSAVARRGLHGSRYDIRREREIADGGAHGAAAADLAHDRAEHG